jgi:flagellar biosynthesis GTPase FlhF
MMADEEGWVYVLTNERVPGLVKIGKTSKVPEIRAKELSSETGVPGEWVVVYKAFVPGYSNVERIAHDKLKAAGQHDSKEYFTCKPFEAIRHIRDSTTIKFEESKEDVDRRIENERKIEEQQREAEEKARRERERKRLAKEKAEQEAKEKKDFERAQGEGMRMLGGNRRQDSWESHKLERKKQEEVDFWSRINFVVWFVIILAVLSLVIRG